MAFDLSKNEDFQRLFLLELLVDSVKFDYKRVDLSKSTLDSLKQTCVRFNFLDFPVIEVCEEDFCQTQGNYSMASDVVFRNGKSCFFSLRGLPQRTQCLQLGATIVRQKDEPPPIIIGTTCITLDKGFVDVLNDVNHNTSTGEASNSLKDVFPIIDSKGIKIGSLALLIRLSCFGKAIVTHFKIPQEKEAGYMFANTNEPETQVNLTTAQMRTPIPLGYPVQNDQVSPPDNNIFYSGINSSATPGTGVPETVLGSTPMGDSYDNSGSAPKTSPMIYRGFPNTTPGDQNTFSGLGPNAFHGAPQGNFPGAAQSNFPGSAQGNFPGTAQGNYPGSSQGTYPGTAQANFPGAATDNFPGAAQSNFPGAPSTNFPGAAQANFPGATTDNFPGAAQSNFPGVPQTNFPGAAQGNFPGAVQGNFPGAAQSNFPGSAQANSPGAAQGNFPGAVQGNFPGAAQGNFPGSAQGDFPGAAQGNFPSAAQGNFPGSSQGNFPGAVTAPPPGTFPGAAQGHFPGTVPGTFPGATSGNFSLTAPGTFTGPTYGSFPMGTPGNYPGQPTDAFPGVAPGNYSGFTPGSVPGTFPGINPTTFPVAVPGTYADVAPGAYSHMPQGIYSGGMPASEITPWGTIGMQNDGLIGGFAMQSMTSAGEPGMALYKPGFPLYAPTYLSEIGMGESLPYSSTNLISAAMKSNIDNNIRKSYKELAISINGHEFTINVLRKSRPKKEKPQPLLLCGRIPEIEDSDSDESTEQESTAEIEEEYREKGDDEKDEEIPKILESNVIKKEKKKNTTNTPEPPPLVAPTMQQSNPFRLCECDIALPKGFRLPEPPATITKPPTVITPPTPPSSPSDKVPQTQVDSPPQSASNHAIVKTVSPPPPIVSNPVVKEKEKIVKPPKKVEKAPQNIYCLQPDCPMGFPWPPNIPQEKRIIKVPCCSQLKMHPGSIGLKGDQIIFQMSNGQPPDFGYNQNMLNIKNDDKGSPYVLKLGSSNLPKCKSTKMILELPVPKLKVKKIEKDETDTQYLESDNPFIETVKLDDGKKKGKKKGKGAKSAKGKKGGKKGKKK